MTVYHGGFSAVKEPKILQPEHSLDFGAGFYTTTDFDQARKWSLIKKDRFGYEKAVVSSYKFDNEIFTDPELLEELMTWKYVDQICFRSEKALQNVKFIRAVEVTS